MASQNLFLNYFWQRDRVWIFALFTGVSITYFPFLGNAFFFDDWNFFTGDIPERYAHTMFNFNPRWLSYATLGWTANIFSDVVPHFFRLGNALLHAVNVTLLFYLLRQLVNTTLGERQEPLGVIWGACLGALVFACHPIAVYAVGYVIQRSILLATLFSLLTQLAYIHGLLTGQKHWLLLAVIAYFLAVFSKEHSVVTLAILAAMTIVLREKNQTDRRALLLTWGAFISIGMLMILRIKGVFGTPYEAMSIGLFEQQGIVESTPMLHLLSILTQAGLFFKYLMLWVLPNPAWMSVDMRETFISSWTVWQEWLGAIGFISYGLFAGWLLFRPRLVGLIGLALLYPWVQFLVEFSSIRVQEPFVLYRSYLWMPGLMLLFPVLLTNRIFTSLNKWKLTFAFVLMLVPLAWNRLWIFGDDYRLWDDAVLLLKSGRESGADRIFYNRGQASAAAHKWGDAIMDYKRAVIISPRLAPIRDTLAWAYLNSGNYRDAIAQYDEAIFLKPDDAQAYYGKGLSLMGLHDSLQAAQQIKRGCELGNKMACTMAGWSKKN